MIDKGRILAIKQAAVENREELFEMFGLELNDRGTYYNGCCPIHGGDNPTAFSITKKDLTWKCWTGNCHMQLGNDIYSLVRLLKGVRFQDAVKIVESAFSGQILDYEMATEVSRNAKFIDQTLTAQPAKPTYYPEDCLARLDPTHPYLKDRGFTPESLKVFGGGYCGDSKSLFCGRYILPVRDSQRGLVGFTGRLVDDLQICDVMPKWKHEGKLHRHLFGYNVAREAIRESQTIILVEGPLKVMRLWEAGIKNCVAIFGVTLSEEQYKLILESGALTVILALDDDPAGQKGTVALTSKLEKYFYINNWTFPIDLDKMKVIEITTHMARSGYEA